MPTEAEGLKVLRTLASRYPSKRQDHSAEILTYHDTFDWRLFRDGGVLTSTSDSATVAVWKSLDGLRSPLELDVIPAFARDLPAGSIRDQLEPLLEMRRLLPVVEIEQRRSVLHVMDDEEKTVVRVVLRQALAGRPGEGDRTPLPVTLEAQRLRGYDWEYETLVRFLHTELGLVTSEQDDLRAALTAIGRQPGDYTSKLRLHLDPSARADETLALILRSLLSTLLRNEDGTRQDRDSEFLHDFRVSVRRTRSALTQVKEVFPPQVVDHFRQEFAWLGKVTGPTRDLDVYLLKIEDYENALPAEVRPDLAPLRDFLARRQKLEQQRLVSHLDSDRYVELIRAWEQFLRDLPRSSAPHAACTIRQVASQRIWRAWRRVWKKGKAIGPRTPARALHDLRIDGKKLRYLLEFFRSLYTASEVDALIKALKHLQENLGDFQDLEVQQDKLREFAVHMQDDGVAKAPTLLAMGELVAGLRQLQTGERLRFAERFARFTQPRHRRLFRRLFGPA